MSVLSALTEAMSSGAVEVVDLTTPLQESTPVLELPAPFANTSRFRLEELTRYDDRGPAWYPEHGPPPASLRHLDRLPATGAVLVGCPLPIVGGSGSPTRVLALVEA